MKRVELDGRLSTVKAGCQSRPPGPGKTAQFVDCVWTSLAGTRTARCPLIHTYSRATTSHSPGSMGRTLGPGDSLSWTVVALNSIVGYCFQRVCIYYSVILLATGTPYRGLSRPYTAKKVITSSESVCITLPSSWLLRLLNVDCRGLIQQRRLLPPASLYVLFCHPLGY